ncbi:TPA: hypothetical protein ACH3X1_002455 [Trebouxia sp. C0004]
MTQVQTIGGLKRGRGRGSGRGRGRGGRGAGRTDKPAAFEAFKGSGNSLGAQQAAGGQQHQAAHGSGIFAAEQQHLTGIAKLQQQHDEALALRAVQQAELQRQQQPQASTSAPPLPQSEADIPTQLYPVPPARSSFTESDLIDLCDDDSGQPGQQSARPPAKPREKMSWSLGVNRAMSGATASTSTAGSDNPFWCPARYVPTGGDNQPDLRLQTHEVVQAFDSGLVGHRGTAILDTGVFVLSL